MKPKTMILMVVAVGCGLGASYMTSRLLADRNKAAPVETVAVLVARTRVPSWQPIKEPEKLFEIKQYPRDIAPKRVIGTYEEIKDKRFKNFLEEGKPVTADELVGTDMQAIVDEIKPGQRATAIKVNAETLVGGFIAPGSRVDVFCTMRVGEVSAKLILQDMLVLAVDQIDQKNPDQKTILGTTATLAATLEEGGRLALAGALGELRLLLRNPGDQERVRQLVITAEDLNKPLNTQRRDDEGKTPEEKEPAPGPSKVELPATLPAETKEAPKVAKAESLPVPEKDEVKPQRRTVRNDEEDLPLPNIELNPKKAPKRHTIYIREGATQRAEQVDTFRKDDETEGDDEEADPVPAKKEAKAEARPQPRPAAQPRTNPGPAAKNGSSTKMGRTRYGN